jgi:YfiH family protein
MTIRPAFVRPGIVAAHSTRRGPASSQPLAMNMSFGVGDAEPAVTANRSLFFGSLGIGLGELAIPGQVHGVTIRRVCAPGSFPGHDGLMTGTRRVFLCITVADCVPILVCAPEAGAVGAFHAGWRGTAGRIAASGVQRLAAEFGADPARMFAFVGPAAGACCYEVGEEVVRMLDPRFVLREGLRMRADLKGANAAQLEESGIPAGQIEVHPGCTIMDRESFHSFRRDGTRSGRMMAVIGIP